MNASWMHGFSKTWWGAVLGARNTLRTMNFHESPTPLPSIGRHSNGPYSPVLTPPKATFSPQRKNEINHGCSKRTPSPVWKTSSGWGRWGGGKMSGLHGQRSYFLIEPPDQYWAGDAQFLQKDLTYWLEFWILSKIRVLFLETPPVFVHPFLPNIPLWVTFMAHDKYRKYSECFKALFFYCFNGPNKGTIVP